MIIYLMADLDKPFRQEYDSKLIDLHTKEATIATDQAEVDRLGDLGLVKAPFSGTVTRRLANIGAKLTTEAEILLLTFDPTSRSSSSPRRIARKPITHPAIQERSSPPIATQLLGQ
jgi:hypothetical protein